MEAALKYFDERHWAIHPLEPREKKPIIDSWNKWSHELPTREQIIAWWTENPNYNIGLVTGRASGVVVLDIDLQKNPNALVELEAIAGSGIHKKIVCPFVRTPGGGIHAYFRYPEDANIGCTSIGIEGIHTRGNGGNIVLPPSVHPNGGVYNWNLPLEDRDLPPLPDVIVARLDKNRPAPKPRPANAKLNPNDLLSVMMERCAFCREFTPDTGDMHEELWYRWLTQMICYEGGTELAYELSSGSPKFNDKTTQAKIRHAQEALAKGLAPYTCEEIIGCEGWKSEECQSCIANRRKSAPAGLPYILRSLETEKARAGVYDTGGSFTEEGLRQRRGFTGLPEKPSRKPSSDDHSKITIKTRPPELIPDEVLDEMAEKAIVQEVDLFQKKKTKEDFCPYFKKDTFIPKLLADDILSDNRFINVKGLIYRYQNGVYIDDGEQFIEAESQSKLGNESRQNRISETVYYIKVDSYTEPELVNPADKGHLINVQNGLYDWIEGNLLPHTPEYLSTIRIPIEYNPEATCPTVDYFLNSTLPADCVPIAEELFGYALIPYVRFEKAFMFTGTGANGKSTFLTLIEKFVGSGNVSKVPLQDLDEHRFKRAELFGKLLNLFADLDARDLQSSTYFKTIVSGDAIDAERKFQDPFFFRPFARLAFSANEIPRSPDNSYAYFRRWCIIPFPKRFEGKDADKSLADKMTEPSELSGLLNRALSGLHRLFSNEGFNESVTIRESLDDYKKQNDTVAAFINDYCELRQDLEIERTALYDSYVSYCKKEGYEAISRIACYNKVRAYPQVGDKKEPKTRCFTGIGIKGNQ